jgi:hypothetical protein
MKEGELWRITMHHGTYRLYQDSWQYGDVCVVVTSEISGNALVLRTGKRITISNRCAEKVDVQGG